MIYSLQGLISSVICAGERNAVFRKKKRRPFDGLGTMVRSRRREKERDLARILHGRFILLDPQTAGGSPPAKAYPFPLTGFLLLQIVNSFLDAGDFPL